MKHGSTAIHTIIFNVEIMKKLFILFTVSLLVSATGFSAYFGGDLKKSEGIATKTATFNISPSMGANFVCLAEARGTQTYASMYGVNYNVGACAIASVSGTTATETVNSSMRWYTWECQLNYAQYTLRIESTASADAHCNAGIVIW